MEFMKLLDARKKQLAVDRTRKNAAALESLVKAGVPTATAREALQMTVGSDGLHSDFRAHQVLAAAFPEHRSPELQAQFPGVGGWSLDVAHAVQQVAFYAESTIEALILAESTATPAAAAAGMTMLQPVDAAREVVMRKERETHEKWVAQMQAQVSTRTGQSRNDPC